jgi:hypothetical protein
MTPPPGLREQAYLGGGGSRDREGAHRFVSGRSIPDMEGGGAMWKGMGTGEDLT